MTEPKRHVVFCVFRGQAIVEFEQVAVILFLIIPVWIVNCLEALANRITDTCFAGKGCLCSFGHIKAWASIKTEQTRECEKKIAKN